MSEKSKKGLKQSIKDCSSAMQSFSENLAEAIRSNTRSSTGFNHLVEESDEDLRMKVMMFVKDKRKDFVICLFCTMKVKFTQRQFFEEFDI